MSQYIVSARKYRPDSFETLLGQDNIARTLSNSIKRGQLAHAYLFCGPRGVGKTTTARFQEGRSYCIHELDAASNNGVDDIKALIEQVQVPPQVGKYSVYIIDEVHMLSQSAFNAFLKTLEEPPAHAIFVLATTEKHKILPTILSRCQTYDFNRIGIPDMVRNLRGIAAKEGVTIDDESLHVIAQKADGAMRDALTIFDQTVAFCGTDIKYEDVVRNLNVLDYDYSFGMVENFLSGSYAAAAALSSHLRDLVVARTAGLDALLELPDSLKQRYREQAARCPLQFLYDALGVTTACEAGYKAAVNPRLHIEFALMKLSFLTGRTDVSTAPRPIQIPSPAPQVRNDKPAAPAPVIPSEAKESPAPAPAPADKTAVATPPAPTRQRRAPKTGSALSINAILQEKEEKPEEEAPAAAEAALPDDAAVKAGWKDLITKFEARPRLANALAKAELRMNEENGVKSVFFSVSNAAQKQWIEEKLLRDLETSFREILKSRKVNLHVDDIPEEEPGEKKPYMPEEKAKDLMDKHPEVRAFVADLGLDTK